MHSVVAARYAAGWRLALEEDRAVDDQVAALVTERRSGAPIPEYAVPPTRYMVKRNVMSPFFTPRPPRLEIEGVPHRVLGERLGRDHDAGVAKPSRLALTWKTSRSTDVP